MSKIMQDAETMTTGWQVYYKEKLLRDEGELSMLTVDWVEGMHYSVLSEQVRTWSKTTSYSQAGGDFV